MDIGTGKVAGRARPDRATRLGDFDMVPLESDGVLHWMLDIAAPGDPFTAASYKAAALAVMAELAARGRLPVVVGGTGLYVRALTEGLEIPAVPPDEALRAELERVALPGLVERLRRLDPDAGEVVDVRNPRRLIRAIEILTHLGGSMAQWRRRKAPPFRFLVLGLCPGSEEVRRRIHERLERRLSEGMVAEVRGLLDGGVPVKTLDDFGLEYRFVTRHLQGRFSLEEMTRQLDAAIVRYAKRQMTWFRKYSSVVWLAGPSEAAPLVEAFLEAP